jgi:hypothetical protein
MGGLANAMRHFLRGGEARFVNIMQRDMGRLKPRLKHNIRHDVFHENRATRADNCDFDHNMLPRLVAV